MRSGFALLLLALLSYWPALCVASWQGTEGRRVQIAHEMLESGDFVVPTLGGEVTLAKPPFHYWVLAAVQRWFGAEPPAMRLPSVLALWLAAWAASRALRPHYGRRAGAIAGMGILCSPALLYHGGFAEIDPMFAALTAISLVWLAQGVAFDRCALVVAGGAVGGLALLTKGPPFFLFFAGSLLVAWRHRGLRHVPWFLLTCFALPGAYYAMLYAGVSRIAGETLTEVVARESVGRMGEFELKHWVDIPLHYVRAVLVALPFGLWTVTEYRGRHEARLQPKEIVLRMCVGAALGGVVLLTFFPGRPVRYLLPAIILFVVAVTPAVAGFTWVNLPPRFGQLLVVRLLGFVGCVGLLVLPWLPFPMPGASILFAFALAVAPFVVRTRPAIVGYALAVPLLAAWTLLPDRWRYYEHGVRSASDVAAILRDEVERLGADELETFGHVPSGVLLHAGIDVPGDEFAAGEPRSRWLVVEDADRIAGDGEGTEPGYRDRVRIRARRRSLVLKERSGS